VLQKDPNNFDMSLFRRQFQWTPASIVPAFRIRTMFDKDPGNFHESIFRRQK
jgi:hypothetical protein